MTLSNLLLILGVGAFSFSLRTFNALIFQKIGTFGILATSFLIGWLFTGYWIVGAFLGSSWLLLPWLEIFTAGALLTGRAVRGSALICLGMLLPFSGAILRRALALHAAQGTAFCAIRFDCGCGTGEVVICHKLIENSLLILLSLLLLKTSRPNPAPDRVPVAAV